MKKRSRSLFSLSILSMKICFFFAMMCSFSPLHAEWVAEECFVGADTPNLQILQEEQFSQLKTKVSQYLKGSWCSEEKVHLLMDIVRVTSPSVCVEIGAFTGSTVLPVAATLKHLGSGRVLAIDAWSNAAAIEHLNEDDPNKSWWATLDMTFVLKQFNRMIKDWKLNNYCKVVQEKSSQAIGGVESIDFLHIDGNYSEIGSIEDVTAYLPKVKVGGYILLSNLLVAVNHTLPKMEAFAILYDNCEMICEIDKGNAVLFRKD